jgi:subtilisin family serine protease
MRTLSRRTALSASVVALAATVAAPTAALAATDDPLSSRQWGPAQVRAEQAWATSTGSGAVIAIVDSGVDLGHPDLKRKLLSGATFLDCGESSCGNGGWLSGPSDRKDSASTHGTHVAGIAAASTGNGVGIAGVARDAKILPVKVLDEDGGSFQDIALGIRWSVDKGADVVNLSLGAIPGVQALTYTGLIDDVTDAVAYARSKGVVVVAAAGNDFQVPLCGTPAFEDGAVCVTATDKREAPAAYSNMGLKPDLAAVAAPGGSIGPVCGEDVVSTVPVGTGRSAVCGYGKDYDEYAGTSMASPHVAGVAALLAAQGRSDDNVVATLLRTSRQPRTNVRGAFTPNYGWGIVDANAAVAAPRG